jgi:hypothetical protein
LISLNNYKIVHISAKTQLRMPRTPIKIEEENFKPPLDIESLKPLYQMMVRVWGSSMIYRRSHIRCFLLFWII